MRRKLTALIALTTTACTSWQVQHGPTPMTVESATDSRAPVRLILRGGGAYAEIYNPQIIGDSIVGMTGPVNEPTRERVAYATADVQGVATNKVSVGRTVLAVAAIALAVLVIV